MESATLLSEDGRPIANEEELHPPLPEFDPRFLEAPGGTVKLRSRFYVERDADGCYRFNARFRNVNDMNEQLDALVQSHGAWIEQAREPLQALYEEVFHHKAFTGRYRARVP